MFILSYDVVRNQIRDKPDKKRNEDAHNDQGMDKLFNPFFQFIKILVNKQAYVCFLHGHDSKNINIPGVVSK